jgi:hypothetical protein
LQRHYEEVICEASWLSGLFQGLVPDFVPRDMVRLSDGRLDVLAGALTGALADKSSASISANAFDGVTVA